MTETERELFFALESILKARLRCKEAMSESAFESAYSYMVKEEETAWKLIDRIRSENALAS